MTPEEIKEILEEIDNNNSGIADYCNLKDIKMIDYDNKEYPIALIEKWALENKVLIEKLQNNLNK